MQSPSFSVFKSRYLETLKRQGKLLLDQIEACETCTCKDYAYCVSKCKKLRATAKALKEDRDFPWLTRRSLFKLYSIAKTSAFCRLHNMKVEEDTTVPELRQVPRVDWPVLAELMSFFATFCNDCMPSEDESCYHCATVERIAQKVKTEEGNRLFSFILGIQAEAKKKLQDKEKEILYYYQRLYQPPVKVDYFPVDPWGIFIPKLFIGESF